MSTQLIHEENVSSGAQQTFFVEGPTFALEYKTESPLGVGEKALTVSMTSLRSGTPKEVVYYEQDELYVTLSTTYKGVYVTVTANTDLEEWVLRY